MAEDRFIITRNIYLEKNTLTLSKKKNMTMRIAENRKVKSV